MTEKPRLPLTPVESAWKRLDELVKDPEVVLTKYTIAGRTDSYSWNLASLAENRVYKDGFEHFWKGLVTEKDGTEKIKTGGFLHILLNMGGGQHMIVEYECPKKTESAPN